MHKALFHNEFSLTLADIKRIHKMTVKNMDITTGWKKLPNYLLARNVKTTPPENVAKEMQKLLHWYEEMKHTWHPLKIATHFHAKFEQIHPFEDGNGRVGRILFNLILLKNKFPPLIIRKTMRVRYFACLEAADQNHYPKIEQFFVQRFRKSYTNFFEEIVKYL